MSDRRCPCGEPLPLARCCEPIINRQRPAATASELMRSRYSAFATGNVAHLLWSWDPLERPQDLEIDSELTWTGLSIVDAIAGNAFDSTGEVHFVASFERADGTAGELRERSTFARHDGRWVYVRAT